MHETAGGPTVKRNIVRWGAIGTAAGCLVGLFLGLAFMTPGRFGFWMVLVAPTIFFGGVSAFTAGIASLDSPRPGDEPPDEATDHASTSSTDR